MVSVISSAYSIMYKRKTFGKPYQLVTDKYEACVLFLLSLLGNKAEKSLFCLVIRAVRNPEKLDILHVLRTPDCRYLYSFICSENPHRKIRATLSMC